MTHPRDVVRQRLWLVRHGETEWALLGRHTGRTDVPLTDTGRDQARALGGQLAQGTGRAPEPGAPPDSSEPPVFARILTSPRERAGETAALAGFGDLADVEPDLAEWDYGALEGLTTAQIRERVQDWTIWTGPWPGGETVVEVGARADRVLARAATSGGDVLLFSHGHLLRVLAARWLGLAPDQGRLFSLSTGTISILGWDRENPVVERWNAPPPVTVAPR